MSILKEIYEYKIDFVNKQKKLHTQSDILNKLKNITSQDFSFSKKLRDDMSRTSIIGELKRASPSLGNFVNEEIDLSNLAQLYEECGVSCLSILTDEKYFKGGIEDLIEIEGFDEKIAEELRERALTSLKEKEESLKEDISKMGISEELSQFEGLTPSILVKLGNAGVKTVDDLADLSSDELKEALEEITLSNKEADEIIMSARSSWFDDDKKEENNEEN